jgi:hypothetical protein
VLFVGCADQWKKRFGEQRRREKPGSPSKGFPDHRFTRQKVTAKTTRAAFGSLVSRNTTAVGGTSGERPAASLRFFILYKAAGAEGQ